MDQDTPKQPDNGKDQPVSDDIVRIGRREFLELASATARLNPADFPPEVWAEIETTRGMTADQLAASYVLTGYGLGDALRAEIAGQISAANTLAQPAIRSLPERFDRMPAHRLRRHAFSVN